MKAIITQKKRSTRVNENSNYYIYFNKRYES